jgi:hypothetical protein
MSTWAGPLSAEERDSTLLRGNPIPKHALKMREHIPQCRRCYMKIFGGFLLLACLLGAPTLTNRVVASTLEREVDRPNYAVIDPVRTNLSLDGIVLVCEQGEANRILQLKLYTRRGTSLVPRAGGTRRAKLQPRAEIAIDDRVISAEILFADDYAILADGLPVDADRHDEVTPRLSKPLLDAMADGRTMVLRLDLVAEKPGQKATYDGEVVIDLRSAQSDVSAVIRQCSEPVTGLLESPQPVVASGLLPL